MVQRSGLSIGDSLESSSPIHTDKNVLSSRVAHTEHDTKACFCVEYVSRVAEGKHDVNDLHSIYGPHINTLTPVTTIRDADMTLEELGSNKDDGGGSGDARR